MATHVSVVGTEREFVLQIKVFEEDTPVQISIQA